MDQELQTEVLLGSRRILLHMCRADDVCTQQMAALLCVKCHGRHRESVTSNRKSDFRKSMRMKNNPAKFHPDSI